MLHHLTYVRKGCERFSDVCWMCERHHKGVHKYKKKKKIKSILEATEAYCGRKFTLDPIRPGQTKWSIRAKWRGHFEDFKIALEKD